MGYRMEPMNEKSAREICTWQYEEPYSIYNLSGDEECLKELLNGTYCSVSNDADEILGFFCYGDSAQVPCGCKTAYEDKSVLDIGLGMKPAYTGKGSGFEFVKAGLKYGKDKFKAQEFRLTVATFNRRAVKVYEKLGFKPMTTFLVRRAVGDLEFMTMIL